MSDLDKLKADVMSRSNPFNGDRPPTKWERFQASVSVTMMTVVAALLCAIIWVVYKPANLEYRGMPWPVTSAVVHPGDSVPVQVTRCNHTNKLLIYGVTRGVKNLDTGMNYVLQSTRVAAEPGCHTDISQLHVLPKNLAPGRYIVTGVGEIPDVLNTKQVEFYSQPFKVE